jgi:hypothetical protein
MDGSQQTLELKNGAESRSNAAPCSALWVNCVGCCSHTIETCRAAGQCEKCPEWKSPTTPEELAGYAEAMSCSIFRARKEIKRLQSHVDAMEPIFAQLVNLEQND